MRKIFCLVLIICTVVNVNGGEKSVKFSTGGFYELAGAGRSVSSLNPIWQFYKGDIDGAHSVDFDDKGWDVVNLPNGIELLPLEASGGVNYRGVVWYRKDFSVSDGQLQRRNLLYFEAIMGKSQIWVNGTFVKEHFGGFTPIVVDISNFLTSSGNNVIAVRADNSDDIAYPPGKTQTMLDFCYFGGIYRDVWLIATDKNCYITDANMAGKVAGGGVFAHFSDVSDAQATIGVKVDVACGKVSGGIDYELMDGDAVVAKWSSKLKNGSNESGVKLKNPKLWSPDSPNLYTLNIRVKNGGKIVDGYSKRIGIKSVKFTPSDGFTLNGKPYGRKLIGANRHQDFAVIGNALSNSLHYRDAAKLKGAGMDIIRNAHYPQDPAFMDACDELGLFVIENTPGWQFWNDDPIFEQRVYNDIAQIVRRDRNHASVLMWEPILNETWYPETFAATTRNIVKTETPYDGTNYTAADSEARGANVFDILYAHPADAHSANRVYFNREWGDNVDDWNSHNSTSRVARQWGEVPQLVQAMHYADPSYKATSYARILAAPVNFIGGTLWHSFDHQRGYHPDPFYGGIMDAMRNPKYSYYIFQAQSRQTAPMVFIANELTPFSPTDVTVFSNCNLVRLRTPFGDTIRTQKRGDKMWFTFDKAWDFMADKAILNDGASGKQRSFLLAEGLDENGSVVCSHKLFPARRAYKIVLTIDTANIVPIANGSDMVVACASITDIDGNVKRLSNQNVVFSVDGEAELLATAATLTNPAPVMWGQACAIIRTTTKPGPVTITARVVLQGDHTPISDTIEFVTAPSPHRLTYKADVATTPHSEKVMRVPVMRHNRTELNKRLREVEVQQSSFGESK